MGDKEYKRSDEFQHYELRILVNYSVHVDLERSKMGTKASKRKKLESRIGYRVSLEARHFQDNF